MLLGIIIGGVVGFVVGILVGRKNRTLVEKTVSDVKNATKSH